MRVHVVVMLLLATIGAIAMGCSHSSAPSATPEPTIDVSGLTPGDIATRALAALQREGQVTHIKEVRAGSRLDDGTYDLWIDWSGKRVRLDEGGYATEILANGIVSFRAGQRSIDVPAGDVNRPEQMFSAFVSSPIDYLPDLRRTEVISFTITSAQADGHPAVLAEVRYHYPFLDVLPSPNAPLATPVRYSTDSESKIYLHATFLPLRVETKSDIFTTSSYQQPVSSYSTEFVPVTAIAEDFFDKTVVFGIGQTPVQRLAFARDTGFAAYWLGETFENAALSYVSGERSASGYEGGARVVTVEYTRADEDLNGLPCGVYLRNYPEAIWREAFDRRKESTVFDEQPKADKELDDFDVPGGRAQIMEEHQIDYLPPTPGATPTEWPTVPPLTRSSIADLPPLPPRGDVADTVGRLTTEDYVIEARLGCRAPAEEKTEALKRILAALRPYPA